ncbi:UDP-N-acetylmuramoyl-tripeptide--D-alanyl-D-alanine ligase [Candidatus Dependentiae bacterium]
MHFSQYFLKAALPDSSFEYINCSNFFLENKICGCSIDSRTIKKDELFIAIEGENFDGHDFLALALKNGASALVIKKDKKEKVDKIPQKLLLGKLLIFVDDTLQALIELAKKWRQEFDYPVVGITGSIGKTTTKEILSRILIAAKLCAYISFKNQNNIIGLCLNILKMSNKYNFAVFELGINGVGEMEKLVDILRPKNALITSINNAHTKGLGNLIGIAKEKKKIFKFFSQDNIGVVNGDQTLLDLFYNFPVIRFGKKIKNHVQARRIRFLYDEKKNKSFLSFILKIYSKQKLVLLKSNHIGFINNSLAASAMATLLGVSFNDIVTGLQDYDGFENRFEYKKLKNNSGIIISDCYNACPESMKAALLAFAQLKNKGKKIAILGNMLELGKREVFWHKQVGRILGKIEDLTDLILVGKLAKHIFKTAPLDIKITTCLNWIEAKNHLDDLLKNDSSLDSLILAKASRGMKLDNLVKNFI